MPTTSQSPTTDPIWTWADHQAYSNYQLMQTVETSIAERNQLQPPSYQPLDLSNPTQTLESAHRELWGQGFLDHSVNVVKSYPEGGREALNIPLWLIGLAGADHLSLDPQERIEMNSQRLVAMAHSVGKFMGQVIDELRTLGSIDSFISSDGKITLQFDRAVSEKIEGFLNEHLPTYGHMENFHLVQNTSDIMTGLTIDAFAMPFLARFMSMGAHSLQGRSLIPRSAIGEIEGLTARSRATLREQAAFQEKMNNPAFRGGIARQGQSISRSVSLSNRAITQIEGRISNWLGEGTRLIRNKAGDPVFLSKDGFRRVRFDFNNSHGDKIHVHFERKVNVRWVDVSSKHRIYPKDI